MHSTYVNKWSMIMAKKKDVEEVCFVRCISIFYVSFIIVALFHFSNNGDFINVVEFYRLIATLESEMVFKCYATFCSLFFAVSFMKVTFKVKKPSICGIYIVYISHMQKLVLVSRLLHNSRR